jgi:arginyl-tRNA synthetase
LRIFGVNFDRYFSEKSLYAEDAVIKALDELRSRGKIEDREGAIWFTMSGEEDDKDRVLVRASGEPTYFAADIAYHKNKLDRGYGALVDIWGSDHHGYVPRVKAGMEALGYAPDQLRVMLVQFVNLIRDGKKISMSTRSGEFVTLREVLDEVGTDAARFFFLTKRSDSHLDFDLDLAKRQSRDNPVYYVQYVHARIASIFRIAAERNINADMTDPDLSALDLPEEEEIMKRLADFPDMLAEAAEAMEPHRVTFCLLELSELFHAYYHDNKVLIEDDRVRKAKLFLVEAVRQVIKNGLTILGVTAPNRM